MDPVAVLHGEVLLARHEGLTAVRADLTHPSRRECAGHAAG
jgi:hypothetical protein